MTLGRSFRLGAGLVLGALVLGGCAPSGPLQPHPAAGTGTGIGRTSLSLDAAERAAHDLGPVAGNLTLNLDLTLRGRDPAGLQALLASGKRVTPEQWAATYGPDPSLVAQTAQVLTTGGLTTTVWQPGDVSISVQASAAAAERFFGVAVHDFLATDGSRFHAPLQPPVPPASIANEVTAVTGMDNYRRRLTAAISDPNGVSPNDMMSFYDITPLRSAGLDGTGITVIFPEWAMPDPAVLAAYAAKFHLPAFNVTVKTDPNWGMPDTPTSDSAGEAALDLEVVHGLAPNAQEIVYELGNPSALPLVLKKMTSDHVGAILSSSIGINSCEQEQGAQQNATAEDAAFTAAAAQGTTIYWASGDRGAYACLPDGMASLNNVISVEPEAGSPGVTGVGGTTVFLASNGGYFKEAAWGEPIEQWGSGGGVSTFFKRPSWQQAPGMDASMTGRGVPDISANADTLSGWDIFVPTKNGPAESPVGGTSAATPCLAAITALIDQDLKSKSLPTVGFANPALYLFAQNPSGLPAPAFHDITTGLGSPVSGALADDFEWYEKNHPSGS
jgi:kumamolisin